MIYSPISSPIRSAVSSLFANRGGFVPSRLFAAGEQGAWYDPSDFNRYMATGPELVVNGDFATDSGWTKNAVVTIAGGAANFDGVTSVNAAAYLLRSSATIAIQAGKTYAVTYTIIGGSTQSISVGFVGAPGTPRIAAGTYTDYIVAPASGMSIDVQARITVGPRTGSIDNISVRELTALDTATLFQDAAGTTPVTAVEQPVGLMLDKSKGLVLGPELVTNGDFSAGNTGWSYNSGGFDATSGALILTATSGVATNTATTYSSGKSYRVTFTITNRTAGAVVLQLSNGSVGPAVNTATYSANGTYTELLQSNGNTTLRVLPVGSTSLTIDNISVRELPGNHAYQTTSTSRPVLSARKNFYLSTETLATQNVTTRAAKYIVSFWGTGSITLSGTAAGTLTGTGADDRVYLEFTATAGTLTSTVSGSVLKAQLEEV